MMINIWTCATLGEYKKMLNSIAVSSIRRDVRSLSSSLMYFWTKIRMDTFGDLDVNCVFIFPSVSAMIGLQSFQHSTRVDSLCELSHFLSIKADPLITPVTTRQTLEVQSVSYGTWCYTSNSNKYVLQSVLHCLFQRNTRIILSSLTCQSPHYRRAKSPGKKVLVRFAIQLCNIQCAKAD